MQPTGCLFGYRTLLPKCYCISMIKTYVIIMMNIFIILIKIIIRFGIDSISINYQSINNLIQQSHLELDRVLVAEVHEDG